MIKTTVVLDEALLQEAKKAMGVTTNREAIDSALREIVKRYQRERLIEEAGTYDLDLTQEDIRRMRESE